MIVTGKIISQRTGAPIPYASVSVVDQYGRYLNSGTAANAAGDFTLNSGLIYDPNALIFSSTGYEPIAVDSILIDEDPILIRLVEKPGSLENVTITASIKKKAPFILAALFLLALIKHKK